ncbi:MAG TPA: NAD(P)/FAD-dependent oxidoreductase [Chthoniobacterales bacterium]|nr:NAD(P)/FAD-dependent oxidoreductase [Chthoniobacterales bacterium]
MEVVDVAIVGGGPAGSTCAAFCAAAGLRTLLLEREKFPREKVCGDCINPACWPVLGRLEIANQILTSPHARLDAVEFIAINRRKIRIDLPRSEKSEIAIKRSIFDQLLLSRARDLGAEVREEATLLSLNPSASDFWKLDIVHETFLARFVVAADGRNSTVARMLNLLPKPARERVALQAHIPLPRDFGNRVVLQFLPEGYSGQAPVNERELNLCLVGTAPTISSLRKWAESEFNLPSEQPWRTITPLTRDPIPVAYKNVLFIGDAARVVEPFTGEGIYYALRSGELAAGAIAKIIRGEDRELILHELERVHCAMYRGRLWINRLARAAVLSPQVASALLPVARFSPAILRLLTRKIVRPA